MPTTEEDGINIFVEDMGCDEKGTIVLVHGAADTHLRWEYQVNTLSRLGYRVISIDMRGHGDSDKPFGTYSLDLYADDLKEVLDCLGVEGVTLVGHSLGAAVVLHYAARHCCAHVAQLVSVGTALPPPFPPPILFDLLIGLVSEDKPALDAAQIEVEFAPCAGLGPPAPLPAPPFEFPPCGACPASVRVGTDVAAQTIPLFNQIEDFRIVNVDTPDILAADAPKICVPVLFIHGLFDFLTGGPAGAEAYAATVPNSTFVVFENSGHLPMYCEKARFSELVASVTKHFCENDETGCCGDTDHASSH